MQTRSKKTIDIKTNDIKTIDIKPIDIKPIETVEQCVICFDDSVKPTKILHSGINWTHCFHENCIDEWYLTCVEKNTIPCCPFCPDTPFPKKYTLSPNYKNKYNNTKIAKSLFRQFEDRRWFSSYIGIMICFNGECVLKITNVDLCNYEEHDAYQLEHYGVARFNNDEKYNLFTLFDIKQKILGLKKEIYKKVGGWSPQTKTLQDKKNYVRSFINYPNLKIIHNAFVVQPGCINNIDIPDINDDTTIKDMYINYIIKLEEMKNDPNLDPEFLEHIHNIISKNNKIACWLAVHVDFDYTNPF